MTRKFTKMMAAIALLFLFSAPTVGWGQTYSLTPDQASTGSSATSYITTLTEFTYNGISWKMNQWNPNTLQVKTNQSSAANEFRFYNTSAIPGRITQVVITFSALTVTDEDGFMFVGGSSEISGTTGGTSATWNSTTKTLTWTPAASDNFTFFAFYQNGKVASGTNNLVATDAIVVTYESGYTVTFDCDGGEGCPSDMTVQSGENNFTVPSTVPTKDCYTFDNVYLDENLEEYEPGETYTITSDLELTASWTKNKYTVHYHSNNDPEEDIDVPNLDCGSSYTIAGDPGFTAPTAMPNFINWNTQAGGNGTAYEVGDEITISADVDLYAQWSASQRFTVTYVCNGGTSGCPESQFVMGETQIQLPAAPIKEGYVFVGWLIDEDTELYAAGADYSVIQNVEFEAIWMEKLDTPTISVAGVSNGTANTYYVTATVTMLQSDEANIYYTTDGSTPTSESTEYSTPFSVTETCTIKAIAIFEGYANSEVAEQAITIVQPSVATFTGGIYNDLTSGFGGFHAYNVEGDQEWTWTTYVNNGCAYMNGYSSGAKANEDWLISPKMVAENGKLVVSFESLRTYSGGNIKAKYSTNYDGYSDPTSESFEWTDLSMSFATSSNWKASGNAEISGTNLYFAIVYTSTTSSAGAYYIKNFTAKQCYPVNYDVNGGTGTMSSDLYAVGKTVNVPYPYYHDEYIEDGFVAPDGMAFASWNTQANGQGTTYNPGEGDSFEMGTSAVNLYAQWATAYQVTVGNPANVDILASIGSLSIVNGESANAVAGMRIELIVQEVAQGYEFGSFIVTKENGGTVEVTYEYDEEPQFGIYYFIMPADNVIVTATTSKITTVVDELTREFIGNTNQSYSDWSGKKSESTAVYAGNTSGGGSDKTYIQLKSNDSNSGIVTTASGGKVKKVSVTWNSGTTSGRTLDVYGKNTPYSAATDLYATSGNTGQGTQLGSIVKGTSTELTVDGDYTYIGLRSKSGAMYIDKIEITWDNSYSATSSVTAHNENTGWYFIASPFSANNSLVASDASSNIPVALDAMDADSYTTDLYYYDEPTHTWMNYKQHSGDFTFANGVGYLYANTANVTLTFAGTSLVANESKSVDLSYTENAAPLAGWNLVGNPFDCPATLNLDCYTISGMAINTQAHTANNYTVAPCTGVMVKATAVNQTVTFTKATQGQAPQPSQLQMTVAQQVNSRGTTTSIVNDNAIVNFNEGSQLEKFAFNIDAAKLYIPQNGKDYAIVSAEGQGEMPVNFRANTDGQYTLTVNPEGVEMNYLHLIDNMTGNDVDLLATPSYTFNATTRDYESRFRLVFAANNENGVSAGSTTFAYFSNGSLVVNNEGNATLQVVDVMGRIVKSESINGSASINVNAAPGVYTLRLVNGNDVKTQKVVVR